MKRHMIILCSALLLGTAVAHAQDNPQGLTAVEEQNLGSNQESEPENEPESEESPAPASYVTGTVNLQYQGSKVSGSNAKADEYQARGSGPSISTQLEWGKDDYQFLLDGTYSRNVHNNRTRGFNRDWFDFSAQLKRFNQFTIKGHANTLGHNMSDGVTDKKHLTGKSYQRLTGSRSDFTFNRQRTGAGFEAEVSFDTPMFASFKIDTQRVEGLLPLYNVNSAVVPYAPDYTTTTLGGQVGYRTDDLIVTVDGSVDKLDDNTGRLRAQRNDITGAYSGNTRLPVQESNNYTVGGALTYRMPFASTTLMLNGNFSNMKSDSMLSSRAASNSATTAWDDYKGDIETTNINGALTTSPFKGFTAKFYGRYYERDNKSEVSYNADWLRTASAAAISQAMARDEMAFFGYDKTTLGTEFSQRFGRDYKVTAGYEWLDTNRDSYGITRVRNTEDNRAWGEVKAALSDSVGGRVRYQYLHRSSSDTDDVTDGKITNPSSGVIAPWFSYANTAGKDQHQVKAGIDVDVTEQFTVALDYIYTLDDYTMDQPLGMKNSDSHAGVIDLSYSLEKVQFTLYAGLEFSDYTMRSRVFSGVAQANPHLPETNTSYNWDYRQKDMTWSLGFGSTIHLIEDQLNLQLNYDFSKNDGRTSFHIPAIAGFERSDIAPVNDYTQHNLTAKLHYTPVEQHTVSLGYSYSKLDFEDWGYKHDSVSSAQELADGYYNVDPSYESHSVGIAYKISF